MSFRSVRIVARFCISSTTHVSRFLSSPFILPRSNYVRNNLLPTTRISSFHASTSRFCSSVCFELQSESTHTENTIRPAIESVLDSVVKIFSFCSEPMVVKPWLNLEGSYTGSGFVISGKRILTNAHVVDNDDSYVQVKKHGSPTKYTTQ